jgi:hypothetical protein
MNSVNSNLPAAAVEDAIKMHVTTLKAVIDAQKAGDATKTLPPCARRSATCPKPPRC